MSISTKDHPSPTILLEPPHSHADMGPTVDAIPATRALLDLQVHPACLMDPSGHLQGINASWLALAGSPPSDMAGRWLDLVKPTDHSCATAHLSAAVASAGRVDFECQLLAKNGGFRWHQLRLQPVGTAWICVATDIEAAKAREEELHALARSQTEMLNVGPDCIKLITGDGRLIHANRAGCQALGISEDSGFGMPWLGLLPEEIRPLGEAALAQARAGLPARFSGRSVLPGRAPQYWDNMLTPTARVNGHPNAILCISREVTGEHEAQESLKRSQRRLAMAASVGGLGVWDYDTENDVMTCDDAWYRIMGRDRAQPIHSIAQFRPIIHPEDVDRATEVNASVAHILATQGQYKIEFRVIHPDGDVRWIRSVAALLQENDGEPTRAIGFVVDITDARHGELTLRETNHALELERQVLTRQSMEDPLTGLANRRVLDTSLEQLCRESASSGKAFSVAMVDVDFFKAYNDRYGHLKGDDVLKGIAKALTSVARQTDLVARFGGEEFVAVFPSMADPEPMLRRLLASVEALQVEHGASPLGRLTVSCGCVVVRAPNSVTPSDILAAGDAALYDAKRQGRNQFVTRMC